MLISCERPSSVWLLLREWLRVINYPGLGNFFGTLVPGTRLTSLILLWFSWIFTFQRCIMHHFGFIIAEQFTIGCCHEKLSYLRDSASAIFMPFKVADFGTNWICNFMLVDKVQFPAVRQCTQCKELNICKKLPMTRLEFVFWTLRCIACVDWKQCLILTDILSHIVFQLSRSIDQIIAFGRGCLSLMCLFFVTSAYIAINHILSITRFFEPHFFILL